MDDVRTASEETWGVFLREFKRWCASEEVHALVKLRPINILEPDTPTLL